MSLDTSKAVELPEDTRDGCYVVCPWCKARFGDAWEWCKQDPREETCEECGNKYICWADVSVDYCARPIQPPSPDSQPTPTEGDE